MNNCDHCQVDISSSAMSVMASILVVCHSAMVDEPVEHLVCGECSFELAEFLCPSLKNSERFQADKREVLRKIAAEHN